MNGTHADAALISNFRLLAQSASTLAPRFDGLFTAMAILSSIVALTVFALIVAFSIRYRRGAGAHRKKPVERTLGIELAWTLIPLAIFLGLFAWAAFDFMRIYRPPDDALPVYVVAKQWMWKLQHRNGKREINELHVPLGQPVRLIMTSEDVIHDFFVPAFRLKHDVVPGRYSSLWFTATEPGTYRQLCTEYCGSEHSQMIGTVVVMPPAEYAKWAATETQTPSLAQYGYARFQQYGCANCHAASGAAPKADDATNAIDSRRALAPKLPRDDRGRTIGPSLDGLMNRPVPLQDGRSVIADETYVRDAIVTPNKHVVAGYAPAMPSYQGRISEDDIQAVIAYLQAPHDANGAPR